MTYVEFLFYEGGRDWMSKATRWLTQANYTHVAIRIGETVYESLSGRGVIRHKQAQYENLRSTIRIATPDWLASDYQSALESQVGRGYDYAGIASFAFPFVKQDRKRWYCSELASLYFELAGIERRGLVVSPQRFYERARYYTEGVAS